MSLNYGASENLACLVPYRSKYSFPGTRSIKRLFPIPAFKTFQKAQAFSESGTYNSAVPLATVTSKTFATSDMSVIIPALRVIQQQTLFR